MCYARVNPNEILFVALFSCLVEVPFDSDYKGTV